MTLRKFWFRFNVLLAFLPLLILDFLIWLTTEESFYKQRMKSLKAMRKTWYKD